MSLISDTESIIKKLEKFPFSRLAFVTIRDPTQKTKWCEISKIRTWCRRYSNAYIIVRGLKGGVHFHILLGIEPNRNVRCQKGIHFHIKYLNDHIPSITYDTPEEIQDSLKYDYYRNQKYEDLTEDIDINCQCIISQINAMIKKYWQKKANQKKKQKVENKKRQKIISVLTYLQDNLNENPELDKYITHWY